MNTSKQVTLQQLKNMLDKMFEEEKVQVCTIHGNCEEDNKENIDQRSQSRVLQQQNIEPLVVKKRERKLTAKLEDVVEKEGQPVEIHKKEQQKKIKIKKERSDSQVARDKERMALLRSKRQANVANNIAQ